MDWVLKLYRSRLGGLKLDEYATVVGREAAAHGFFVSGNRGWSGREKR
jgi:hypothetical protein